MKYGCRFGENLAEMRVREPNPGRKAIERLKPGV